MNLVLSLAFSIQSLYTLKPTDTKNNLVNNRPAMFNKNLLLRLIIIGNSVYLVFGIQNFESIGVKNQHKLI